MNIRTIHRLLFCLFISTSLFGAASRALFQAVQSDDREAVSSALQQGASMFSRTRGRRTPLHNAALSGNIAIITALLNSITNNAQRLECLESKDRDWKTALHLASEQGHLSAVNVFINQGSNPCAKDEDDNTPLHLAARSGHHNVVWYFITFCEVDPNLQNQSGNRPLHHATAEGHEKIVRYLITQASASIEAINRSGWKPIHLAAAFNRVNIMRYLLKTIKKRVSPKERQMISLGDTPLTRGGNPLHLAVRNEHPEMVALLLAETDEEYIDEKNRPGDTPLHLAACHSTPAIARIIVESGISLDRLNHQDRQGHTPLVISLSHPGQTLFTDAQPTLDTQKYLLAISGKIDADTTKVLDDSFSGWRTYLANREQAVHEVTQELISSHDIRNLIILLAGPHYPSESERPEKKQRTE